MADSAAQSNGDAKGEDPVLQSSSQPRSSGVNKTGYDNDVGGPEELRPPQKELLPAIGASVALLQGLHPAELQF